MLSARFERFWEAYPSHEKRKDAMRVFARINPDHDLLAKMLDAIARWKLTRRWRDGFVPHPAAWLNQERWEDELPAEPAPSSSFRPSSPPVKENPRIEDLMAERAARIAAAAEAEAKAEAAS